MNSTQIEQKKIKIEKEKLALEREKLAVGVLVEDFKARWQELLNFENENSRWQTLYVTALILVIAWVLTNSGQRTDVKFTDIGAIFKGENAYLVLSLALINSVYTLAMAYKGYQIQEIAQYLVVKLSNPISKKAGIEFNSWEKWRRVTKGRPSSIRTIYYSIVGTLPTAVSATIIILYIGYRFSEEAMLGKLNVFFYVVCFFTLGSFLVALYTTSMNSKWSEILADRSDRPRSG
jgi:ABC-type glycerol-3-phosphate transport system permease component